MAYRIGDKPYRIGDKVRMTEDAIENYGDEFDGVIFKIDHRANKYMPAAEFYQKGMPEGYHPGYDEGCGGWLYDLTFAVSGADLPMSLYAWELIPA